MSEHLGTAHVRIVPDTSTFAAELKAQVAAAAATSAKATSFAKVGASRASEEGIKVKNLATATTALTQAQNANQRVAAAAAKSLTTLTGTTDALAIAQHRAERAAELTAVATKAVEKSKNAAALAEKAYAHAIKAGIDEVTVSIEQSHKAAQASLFLAEANATAAASNEAKAASALAAARADEAAAAASATSARGSGAAAGAAATAAARAVIPTTTAGAAEEKAAGGTRKLSAEQKELIRVQNLGTIAASKLAFAQREVAVTTTALNAANEGLRRANAAVTASETALAAAQDLKNAGLIESFTLTLQDAQAKQKAAISTVALAEADALLLTAQERLDNVTRKVAGVTSELGAAQVIAARASGALLASEKALEAALATGNAERIQAATQTNALAIAQEREAISALEAAKAQQVHASQLAFARRGILASALSFTGLRGATLAANSAFIAGAAALLVFAKSLSVATRFETQLNVFRVTTGATADEMERMSAVAVQLGADITLPGVSAGDAAEAMTELAKAGLDVTDAIAGARGVLQLATAANISNADATTLAASALNAFGLAGDQAVRVADVLANAANQAQGSIQDMGLSLQQAAAVGRQVGLSLEDTTVLLTSLQRAGIRGSDAGTSLRTALLRLINPTKKIKTALDELGLSLRDQEGNLRPDFFVNLGIALQGLTKEEKDAKIAILGGADAIRSLSILSRQSIEDLIGLRREIRNQGTAAEVASARTAGLAGAGKALQNVLENVGLAIGQHVTPGLTGFVHGLTGTIAAISANQAVTGTLSNTLAALGDGFQAVGLAIQTTTPVLGAFASASSAVINTIGVTELLGAVLAYKLLTPAVIATGTAVRAMAGAMIVARDATIGLSATTKLLAAANVVGAVTGIRVALTSLATSTTGVGIAVAAVAGGLIYLATRTSATEQATRNLKSALDSLDGSMSAVTATAETLGRATSNIQTEKLALASAKLAAEQAKLALSGSKAAEGSLERAQLENQLKVSLDNVRLAEERLRSSRAAQADAAAELAIRQKVVREDRAKEAAAVSALTSEIRKEVIARQFAVGAGSGTAAGRRQLIEIEKEGIQDLIETLRQRADEEAKGADANSRANARRLEALAAVAEEVQQLPTEHQIELFLEAKNLTEALKAIAPQFGIEGKAAIKEFLKSIKSGLGEPTERLLIGPEIFADLNAQWKDAGTKDSTDYWQAFIDAGKAAKDKVTAAAKANVDAANKAVATAEGAALDLRIKGAFTPQAQLQNLLQKKAAQEKVLAAKRRQFSLGDATKDEVTQAKEDLADTVDAIISLQESIRTDAESAAKDIQDAKDKADDAVIEAFTGGKKRTRIENLLIRAERTEGLGDNIKFNKMLVKLLQNQIKEAGKTIKNLQKRRDFIRDTNKLILQITNQIKDDQAEQRNLLRTQRQERQQELLDRIDADIEFAQIKENVNAEIKARNARIRALQAQQRALIKEKGQRAKNTAEYKNLRNQIAAEKKAIAELRDEQKEMDMEARKLIFDFLKTQQGFAANLLGNLFPSNAFNPLINQQTNAGGTVGGIDKRAAGIPGPTKPIDLSKDLLAGTKGKGVGSTVGPQVGVADAKANGGPTAGQANAEISLLREIRDILLGNYKGTARSHPEAAYQKAAGGATMDVM